MIPRKLPPQRMTCHLAGSETRGIVREAILPAGSDYRLNEVHAEE
jgi:hypothetical protein